MRGARVDPSGYDAGKKVKGKKRHVLVDTLGLLLSAAIHPADVQDRDGAIPLLRAARRLFPFVEVIFADGAYRGETTAKAVAGTGRWRLEIVSRGAAEGFVPLAKRWIVERTFAWLGRCRRLAKDFENLAEVAETMVKLAMIRLMLHRLAHPNRSGYPHPDFAKGLRRRPRAVGELLVPNRGRTCRPP